MRHRKASKRLGRNRALRKATLRDIARSVILHQSIKTTKAKAKEARRLVERLITLGKRGDLSSRRRAYSQLSDHNLVSLLFKEIAPRFKDRNGGYTRIINWVRRKGDNAQVVVLELTEIKKEEKAKKTKAKEEKPEKAEKKAAPRGKVLSPKQEEPKEKEKVEPKPKEHVKEKQKIKEAKPPKKFIGGLRKFFKKERDSL
ncbi:MAG: 50S ribosomal protein L17 [Candidatus Omnitrophota bacterium]